MESIIRDSIVHHMTQNDLFSDAQHGFVPGRNCITQLLLCMEEWTNLMEKVMHSMLYIRILRKRLILFHIKGCWSS